MVKYVFRDDEPLRIKGSKNADPQMIGEALTVIAGLGGGEITPKAVVEAARSPDSALHNHFEWEDRVAAESYRLDQARRLIRVVRIEDQDASSGYVNAFLSVNSGGISYRPVEAVRRSADMQMAVLRQAKRELEGFQSRYRDLQEIFPDLSSAVEKIDRRIGATAETRSAA